ncbi:recombinase family protein [Micromonospora sp. WMMD961]|uniref:recombinase family protein n=1 Tax=Micromonospora sp. WMMD961 TaxID=3016100 RepID=UPI0024161880|nr:recombinase family protein [Micromonospora sp. WMMD961]MDG4783294.1 recombinase family protein [Micromonospora sp. WMMD961]
MTDLAQLLATPGESLDGIAISGDEARAQLGVELYPLPVQTLRGLWVAIYLRISDDKAEDLKGVRRQAVDTIRHVLHRGAAGVVIYEENDTSAFRKKRIPLTDGEGNRYFVWRVIRPRWQAMLSSLRSGEQKAAAVHDIDRLARDPRDLEDAIELAEFVGRRFEGVTGSLDLNSDNGRAMARVMVAMANKASADTSRRTKRKHRELAEEGVPVGSQRPFGWKADKLTLEPAEASEIRTAVMKIRGGVKPTGIMADWQDRGILTPHGNTWRWSPFMSMLRNPRLCGFRSRQVREVKETGAVHDRWEIVKRADGTEVVGKWEKIIDREEWEDLVAKIGKASTPAGSYDEGGRRKYLLTGLVRCGRCPGHPNMSGGRTTVKGDQGYWRYKCESRLDGGCGGNTRHMGKVDELITKLVFQHHDRLMAAAGQTPQDPDPVDTARLAEIDELLADLYSGWKAKKVPSSDYFTMRQDLAREREELVAANAATERSAISRTVAEDVRHRWDSAPVAEKSAFLSRYLRAVIIMPIEPVWSERSRKMVRPWAFNRDLIEPVWL